MRLLFPILIVAAIVLTYFVVGSVADRKARAQIEHVTSWPELTSDERVAHTVAFVENMIRERAQTTRVTWIFAISLVVGGSLLFAAVDDAAHDIREQTVTNCHAFRALVNQQADSVDLTIRRIAGQRSDLADSIATLAIDVEEIPGFDQLGPGVRNFIRGVVMSQVAGAQVQLEEYDAELAQLRAYEDEVSAFAQELNCPD